MRGTEYQGRADIVPGAISIPAPEDQATSAPAPKNTAINRDPTTTDDIDKGYSQFSHWINTTFQSAWLCVSNTRKAAVWLPISWKSAGNLWLYKAKTTATSGYPGDGFILWDNATQTSATHLIFSHLTSDDLDLDVLLATLGGTNSLILQDANASANFQKWTVTGAGVNTNAGTATSYWTFPVTLASSGGTGATGFANNHQLAVFKI